MELKETIEKRRSIRAYKDEDISNETIEDILNCGRLAPSAKNRQPWNFVVVRDFLKNRIADIMEKYASRSTENDERKKLECPNSVLATSKVIKEAPILILVFKEKNENWTIGDNLSIGACIENILLRATDLNLGSLWIRDIAYTKEEIAESLGYEHLELNSAISIGYPNQFPEARPRKSLCEITNFIELNIEKASQRDIADILEIIKTRCEWFQKKNIDQWNPSFYLKKYNRTYFLEQLTNGNELYVAKLNKKVVGAMLIKFSDKSYWEDDQKSLYIHHLASRLDNSGGGVGTMLLNYAYHLAEKYDKEYVRLDCKKSNQKLNEYYQSNGFLFRGSGKEGTYEYNLWEKKGNK